MLEDSCSTSNSSNSNSSENCSSNKKTQEESIEVIDPKVINAYIERIQNTLSKNAKRKDYYKKVKFNKDGHFTNKKKPSITIPEYLNRIIEYTEIEPSTLVLSLIYIERLCKEKIFLSEYNIHRILLLSIIMAYKYNEDCKCNKAYLSKIGGITESEISQLEHEFFDLINYDFFVGTEEFKKYTDVLILEKEKTD